MFGALRLGLNLSSPGKAVGSTTPTFSGSMVGVGDSKTEESGANGFRWLDQFATNTGRTFSNQGLSARSIADLYAVYIANVRPLFAAGNDTIVFWAGTNSIGLQGLNDVQTRSDLLAYVSRARADGFKVHVSPISPRSDGAWDATREGYRLAYNAWVRANWQTFADGLIDIAAIPELLNTTDTYWLSDGLHQTAQGDRRIAEFVRQYFGLARVADAVPNAFTFTDVTSATASADQTTGNTRLSGFNDTIPFTVSAGSYSVNGGAFTSSPGTIEPWDQVRLKVAASATPDATVNVISSAGSVTDTWSVTTAAVRAKFNTTPKNGGAVVYSNSDRTVVTPASPVISHVITDKAITGKKCFFVIVDSGGGVNHGAIGLSDNAASAVAPGFDNHSIAVLSAGSLWKNGSAGFIVPHTNGDTLGVFVDATAKKLWWWKGGNFYGSTGTVRTAAEVEAGTDGYDISAVFPTLAIYGAVGSANTGSRGYTIRDTFPAGTMPASFTLL